MTRRDARLLALLILAPAAVLLGPLFWGRVHYLGDVMHSFQPWLSLTAQEIQAGRLPLWNPYAACGEPLLANPQTMVFFPPAQVLWLFPFAAGWRLLLLVSHAALVAGLYFLYRRSGRAGAALGALAVGWGGFAVVHWEFPSAVATLAMAPFFILCAGRRAWRALPFAAALLLLGGYAQFTAYAALAGGAWAAAGAVRRRETLGLLLCGAAVAAGFLLAGPQVLASWEAARQSVRAAFGGVELRAHLITPIFLVKFLIPDIYDKVVSSYAPKIFDPALWAVNRGWLTTFSLGPAVPALALAAARGGPRAGAPSRAGWAATAAVGLALAMGIRPVFDILVRAVPGLGYMTHYANAMALVVLALGALGAEGARRGDRKTAAAFLAAGAALAGTLALWPAARTWTMEKLLGLASLSLEQHAGVARAAGAAAAAGAAGALLCWPRRGWKASLLLLTCFELLRFGRDLHPTVPDDFYREPVPLARVLQGRPDRFCIDPLLVWRNQKPLHGDTAEAGYQSLRQALHMNMQVPFRIHETWSYEVFPQPLFSDVRHAIDLEKPFSPLLDFLGAARIVTTRELPAPAVFHAWRENAALYDNPGALPRVTWVPSAKRIDGNGERLAYMAGAWRPAETVLIEEAPTAPGGGLRDFGWDDGRPGRMAARGRSKGGWLVWSQVIGPGWEAYVNGIKEKPRKADHAFMALPLPDGEWRADFLYRPPGTAAAVALASLMAAGLAAAGIAALKKS